MFTFFFDFCDGGCSWTLHGLVGFEGENVKNKSFSPHPLNLETLLSISILKKGQHFYLCWMSWL